METDTKSRHVVGDSDLARSWDAGLRRSFACAGNTVWVSLAPLRSDDGAPRFEILWIPGRPRRLLPADIAAFDAGKREALATIMQHLATL